MSTALAAALLTLCATLSATEPPAKPPESPAAFFPPHTYFYLQLNPFQTVAGFKTLQLTRLLNDPTLKALFDQMLQSIPRGSDPREMLKRYPFDRAIGDRIAVGLTGFVARMPAREGTPATSYVLPRDGVVSTKMFQAGVNFAASNILAIKIEDESLFRKTLLQFLSDAVLGGQPPELTNKTVDGVEMQVLETPELGGDGHVYTTFASGYFLLAQSPTNLVEAVQRQKHGAAALSNRTDFRRFQKHRGAKATAGFVHIGIDCAVEMFSPLLPPRDRAEIEKWGGFDFAGVQVGMGFHEGGICEWMHLAFAENPRGLFMNFARLWPSTGYTEAKTRRGTIYAASLTFDWAALYNVTTAILELCDVDTKAFARDARSVLGMDLRDDLMAALGNTVGAVAVMPNMGFIPEPSLVFKVRNRAKMEAVLAKVKAACRDGGIPMKEFSVSGVGPKATYLNLGKDIPVKPAFVLRGDHLVVSMMPLMLKYAVRQSRDTGKRVVDFVPDASSMQSASRLAYFYDPAPMTRNVYADLLKLLDSTGSALPVDATDLPSPEFVSDALSKFGVQFTIDPYYMALDLHSPTGVAIPTLVGSAIAVQQAQPPVRSTNN